MAVLTCSSRISIPLGMLSAQSLYNFLVVCMFFPKFLSRSELAGHLVYLSLMYLSELQKVDLCSVTYRMLCNVKIVLKPTAMYYVIYCSLPTFKCDGVIRFILLKCVFSPGDLMFLLLFTDHSQRPSKCVNSTNTILSPD